jgi:hypothetical protein
MTVEQTLLRDIEESQKALNGPNDDTIYRRDHSKRIELINWVLDNMKNPDIQICAVIESKMNEIIDEINISIYLVNSMKRKIPPETPNATIKPFQKSVKKSLFILLPVDSCQRNLIIHW